MLQINKILFPTDHSASAERAFLHAAFLADEHAAELHALRVTPTPDSRVDFASKGLGYFEEVAERLHRKWEAAPGEAALPKKSALVTAEVEATPVPEAILEYAEEQDVDLIVMGTHGRRRTERMLMGSVAEEVVRRASCPVFTVRIGEKKPPQRAVERLVVPTDFSGFTSLALAHAVELAQTYGARLDLLHVAEVRSMPGVLGAAPIIAPQAVEARARKALEALAGKMGYDQVVVQVQHGHVAHQVLTYAEEEEMSLIVMASHGRRGLKRMLMGSTAEKVVRHAPCPAFIVKSFGKSILPKPAERYFKAER